MKYSMLLEEKSVLTLFLSREIHKPPYKKPSKSGGSPSTSRSFSPESGGGLVSYCLEAAARQELQRKTSEDSSPSEKPTGGLPSHMDLFV